MAVKRVGNLVRRRAVLVGLSVVAIAVGVGVVVGAVDAGSPRYIVFSGAPTDAAPQLYRIQSSGGGLQQITTGANSALDPAYSPGGQRIAFTRLGVGIFTINPDGTGLRRLTTGERDSYPAWAPSGGRIAFVRPVGAEWRVFVLSTSGGTPHMLGKAPPSQGRGVVDALDAETGKTLWQRQLGSPPFGCATVARDAVIVPTYDGTLTAFSAADGRRLWHARLPAGNNSCPAVGRDLLVVAAGAPYPGIAHPQAEVVAFGVGR
jgi:PQQ-like domain/WD40-like Beta Propeller Repeat